VLLVTGMPLGSCGGLSTHMLTLERQLKGRVRDVAVVDGSRTRTIRVHFEAASLTLIRRSPLRVEWLSARIRRLRSLIKQHFVSVDLIHAHDPIAAYAAAQCGVPIVMTCHGPMYEHAREAGLSCPRYLGLLQRIETATICNSARLIAVDKGQRDILVRKGADPDRIDEIPNAVDVSHVTSLARNTIRKRAQPYFLMLRRLVPKNGPQYAVRAFLDWVGDRDVELWIAGDGPLREEIQRLIAIHANGPKVILLGHVRNSDIPGLIARATATLVPSVPFEGVVEATSIAALESLALGVPVIASNIGGLVEIDQGKHVMLLVPPADIGSISSAMESCIVRPLAVERQRLIEHVETRFGATAWCERVLNTYQRALEFS